MNHLDNLPKPVLDLQKDYTQGWLPQSEEWTKYGAHKKAADMLRLKDGDLHIDIGTGAGTLLYYLKQQYPETTIVSVDRSEVMLTEALSRLIGYGIPSAFLSYTDYSVTSGYIEKNYHLTDEMLAQIKEMGLLKPGGPVVLICDDIRKAVALNLLVGDNKADSGSFLFPGIGIDSIFESPTTACDRNNMKKMISRTIKEVRQKAIQYLSARIKKGGSVILGERFGITDELDAKNIQHAFRAQLGNNDGCWDNDETAFIETDVDSLNSFGFIGPDGETITEKEKQRSVIALCKFVRNDKK